MIKHSREGGEHRERDNKVENGKGKIRGERGYAYDLLRHKHHGGKCIISLLYFKTTERHVMPAYPPSYSNTKDECMWPLIHSLSTSLWITWIPPYLCHLLRSCPQAHTHIHSAVHPLPAEHIIHLNNNSDIYSQAPPVRPGFLSRSRPSQHMQYRRWLPTIAASLQERIAILDSDRKHDTGVNPTSESLQSTRNNNRGLAFDVSAVIKAETRVEINRSSLRGGRPSSCC